MRNYIDELLQFNTIIQSSTDWQLYANHLDFFFSIFKDADNSGDIGTFLKLYLRAVNIAAKAMNSVNEAHQLLKQYTEALVLEKYAQKQNEKLTLYKACKLLDKMETVELSDMWIFNQIHIF